MSNQREILDYLQLHFPSLESALCTEICELGTIETISAGQILMEPGKYIKFLPLLCSGLIEVYRNDAESREVLLYYIKAGEVCSAALTCCMTNVTAEIYARSVEQCTIIKIPIQNVDMWFTRYSSWKQFVFMQYRMRFNELLQTIDSLAFLKMDERLIRFLKNIYTNTGKTVYEGSHADIALALSSSREVISRLLKTLEHNKKVVLSRNKIDFSQLV
ncbi:MAG TPA: Crp/Fnr family transcriptional regulator [Bacteroidales bacterium]|jgi:CRP/FNR family transcriptional regulator|nr:Crp/Fnr family transcriptional regulator [Bacteroidales bacterium]